ncbi:hypothetical protein BDW74DRAFT_181556 [Aspergillus multicolor]|uniref:uncharacterized protein n=1 Tax=Aspergillus multicolor TaxID=41759 RepID=UPI003CCCF701
MSLDLWKLNFICILSDAATKNLKGMERALLQCGKKLRLHNASPSQYSLHPVMVCANPFARRDVNTMERGLSIDKAIASVLALKITTFDLYDVHIDTYEKIVY